MTKTRVAVIFGGRSVEHEVSIISAHEVMAALPDDQYDAVPVYIAKSGAWYTGDALRTLANFRDPKKLLAQCQRFVASSDPTRRESLVVGSKRALLPGRAAGPSTLSFDVAFPVMHGTYGEDGTLQGLLEMADIPYVGPNVAAAAISMDKVLTKRLLRGVGLPVLDDYVSTREAIRADTKRVIGEIEGRFAYPVFVKPSHLGSSIGVSRAANSTELGDALQLAAVYDNAILVEPAQESIIEVNCAVLGDGEDCRPSVCEQPVTDGILSYEDKYMSGGKKSSRGMQSSQRLIPAPIELELTEAIQSAACAAFAAVGGSGVTRIDFLVHPDKKSFVINELNPIPGDLSFYLWQPSGISLPELVDKLIYIALHRHHDKHDSTYSIDSWLLNMPSSGTKIPTRER